MSGDVGAEAAAALRCEVGWTNGTCITNNATRCRMCAVRDDLAPLIAERVEAAKAEADAAGFQRGVEKLDALRREQAEKAWDEGHRTPKRYGPDNCRCAAWNESECGCGEYGSNVITLNPHRAAALDPEATP